MIKTKLLNLFPSRFCEGPTHFKTAFSSHLPASPFPGWNLQRTDLIISHWQESSRIPWGTAGPSEEATQGTARVKPGLVWITHTLSLIGRMLQETGPRAWVSGRLPPPNTWVMGKAPRGRKQREAGVCAFKRSILI